MGSTVNMFSRLQEPSGTLRGPSGGPQGALKSYLHSMGSFLCNMEEEEGEEEEEEEDPRAVQDDDEDD